MKLKRTASFLMAMFLALPAGLCGVTDSTYAAGRENIAIAASAEEEGKDGYYY